MLDDEQTSQRKHMRVCTHTVCCDAQAQLRMQCDGAVKELAARTQTFEAAVANAEGLHKQVADLTMQVR
jgi:hypothetical protein